MSDLLTTVAWGLLIGGFVGIFLTKNASWPIYAIIAGLVLGLVAPMFAPGDARNQAENVVASEYGVSTDSVEISAASCSSSTRYSCQAWTGEFRVRDNRGRVLATGVVHADTNSAFLDEPPTEEQVNDVRRQLDLPAVGASYVDYVRDETALILEIPRGNISLREDECLEYGRLECGEWVGTYRIFTDDGILLFTGSVWWSPQGLVNIELPREDSGEILEEEFGVTVTP